MFSVLALPTHSEYLGVGNGGLTVLDLFGLPLPIGDNGAVFSGTVPSYAAEVIVSPRNMLCREIGLS